MCRRRDATRAPTAHESWLEKEGLLFRDPDVEMEFLATARYARPTRAIIAGLCTIASGFYTFSLVESASAGGSACIVYTNGIMGACTLACGVLIFATFCISSPSAMVRTAQVAAFFLAGTVAMYVPYAGCDTRAVSELVIGRLADFVGVLVGNESETCLTASISPSLNATCGFDDDGNIVQCTVFEWLTAFARFLGFYHGSVLESIVSALVVLQAVGVSNLLPARVMLFGIPYGLVILLAIISQLMLHDSAGNLGGSIGTAMECSSELTATVTTILFQIAISVLSSAAALLLHIVASAKIQREVRLNVLLSHVVAPQMSTQDSVDFFENPHCSFLHFCSRTLTATMPGRIFLRVLCLEWLPHGPLEK